MQVLHHRWIFTIIYNSYLYTNYTNIHIFLKHISSMHEGYTNSAHNSMYTQNCVIRSDITHRKSTSLMDIGWFYTNIDNSKLCWYSRNNLYQYWRKNKTIFKSIKVIYWKSFDYIIVIIKSSLFQPYLDWVE